MPFLGGGLRGPKGDTGDPGANGTNALTAQDLTPLNSLIWRNPDADVVRERINNDNSKAFTNFGALPDAFLPTLTDLEFYRDFAGEKTLDHAAGPNITFTRASNATFFDADGVLQTAANDTPRFDHVPATGASRGLLIEEARTNLLLHSADLSNAAWTKTDITAAKDQTGINGAANSASSITATSANGTCLQAITSASAARATSAYVKRITGTGDIEMTQDGGSNWAAVTVTSDWTRVTIASATVTDPSVGFRIVTNGDAIAVDAVQCETGPFATSYIPTTGSTATRAADSAIVTPISSFYNQSEGTLFAEWRSGQSLAGGRVFTLNDNTADNVIELVYANATGSAGAFFFTRVASTNKATAPTSNPAPVANTDYILIGSYSPAGVFASRGGATAVASNDGEYPLSLTHATVGSTAVGARLNGHIRKIAYWPKRLSNTLLEQLST